MNEIETESHSPPIAVGSILKLAADARCSPIQLNKSISISEIIDVLLDSRHQAELAASAADNSIFKRLINERRTENYSVAALRDWLEWTLVGNAMNVLCPTVLRTGQYHEQCNVPGEGRFLLRTLAWRYLASRLMIRRATHFGATPLSNLDDVEKALVLTAKAQRKMLTRMAITRTEIAGDFLALTVIPCAHSDASYLVNVSELCDVEKNTSRLFERAHQAITTTAKQRVNHNIVMTSDISDATGCSIAYSHDHPVHLVGNSDEIRFIVVVSALPDQNFPKDDPDDTYEGRFRLNKRRLRDVFRGVSEQPSLFNSEAAVGKMSKNDNTVTHVPSSTHSEGQYNIHLPKDALRQEAEPAISRRRIARAFFGYRGLLEPDSH